MWNLECVTARISVTLHRYEVDAKTRDRIPGDVAESGGFVALALAYPGCTSEILTS